MTDDLILVGVCTFRRSSLAATLETLASQRLPEGVAMEVVVADNDEAPSAAGRVRDEAERLRLPMAYLHAPAANISVARNAVLDHAEARGAKLVAFIDDDEWGGPDWLAQLVEALRGADAAFGPVLGVYGSEAPDWMRHGRFHDTYPELDAQGCLRRGYSGNALVAVQAPAFRGRRFDPGLGRSGGEDTAFFEDARGAGARLVPAPRAVLHEHVPPDRASAAWLARRRVRMGQTHALLVGESRPSAARVVEAGLAAAKAVACLGLAAVQAPSAVRRNRALLRGCLHVGAASTFLGARPLVLYGGSGQPQAPSRPSQKGVDS